MILNKVIFLVFFLLKAVFIFAQVVVYPKVDELQLSAQYKVTVTQSGKCLESVVYVSEAQFEKNRSKNTAYSIFSFARKVTVTVTKLDTAFSNCKILPSSCKIPVLKKSNTVSFTLDKPRNIAVEFDGSQKYPLLIFANPLEKNIPKQGDKNVLYYGPGYHDKEDTIFVKANQTLYVAGGAVLSAHVVGNNAPNAKIIGRGIISGRRFGHTHGKLIHFPGNQSTDLFFEGFTMVDAPGYYITTGGKRTHAKNVKGLGWWFNTDGFSFGEDGLTEDCFLKCNDDAIKLYRSGNKVYRTTIWQMENGAPFQISWNMNSDNSGFVVKDCDIIRVDHQWDNPNEAVFCAIHGGSGHMSNYLFENIRVENSDWKLVSLQIAKNRWAKADTLGKISNIIFKNITVTTTNAQPMKRLSVLNGADSVSKVTDVLFENVSINGVYLKNEEQGRVEVNPVTASNVKFIVTKKDKPVMQENAVIKSWENPIRNGLGSYGQKDFHIYYENNKYYLTATEYTNTVWPKRGVVLYSSNDLVNWQEEKFLLRRNTVPDTAWYKDVWAAPELHKIQNKYFLTFNCRNDVLRPYKQPGFGIAAADKITGPYKVLNPVKPLFEGNNASLLADGNNVFVYFDKDGYLYAAPLNILNATLLSEPKEIISRSTLNDKFRFSDAPFVFKNGSNYNMLLSHFLGGYIVEVKHMKATSPLGPWEFVTDTPLYSFKEAEANEVLEMPYPHKNAFAPPTQVIFSNQIFAGKDGRLFMAYHSSEKYAEPYLCIEPVVMADGKISIPAAKQKIQTAAR
jgi:Glycosyl hydrolases family 43